MAVQQGRILVNYSLDPAKGDIHRKKVDGEVEIEDRIVARYDAEKQILTFPNLLALRSYKEGVMTFLAENEMLVRMFQRADLKPDPVANDKRVPPRPRKTNHEGDKTKAVVEWYHKFRYNEFCTRYGFLGTYTGYVRFQEPVWEERPGGDRVMEYKGTRWVSKDVTDVLVTLRKTHLSFTPDECIGDEARGILPWNEDEPDAAPTDHGAGVTQRSSDKGGDE